MARTAGAEPETRGRLPMAARVGIVWAALLGIWLLIRAMDVVLGSEYTQAAHVVRALMATVLTVPMILVARRWLDRRPLAGLGLPIDRPSAIVGPFVVGALSWLIPSLIGLGAILMLGWVDLTLTTDAVGVAGTILFLIPMVFLYEALPEELAFRGYLYRNLADRFPRWAAVCIQGFLFALWGSVLWAVTGGLEVAPERFAMFLVVGTVLGLVRVALRSVWASIGLHVAFQVVAQALGQLAVMEGSIVLLEMVVLGAVPFSVVSILMIQGFGKRLRWREREPDLAAGQAPGRRRRRMPAA